MARSQSRIRLTKASIERVVVPPGIATVYVYDDLEPALSIRVGGGGRRVFVWVGRENGRKVRETLGAYSAMTIEQARLAAKVRGIQAQKAETALETGETNGRDITVKGAFDAALQASRRGERSQKDWAYESGRFLEWLRVKYPAATLWRHVSRAVVSEYLATFQHLSDTSQRLAMNPIRQTAKYMETMHDFRNVGAVLKIGNKLKTPPPQVFVSDVLLFLDYLRKNSPHLEVGAALQGLAGLRLLEVVRLTWDKVDLKRGLIEISGEIKNDHSQRVIPLCNVVKDALERAYDETQRGAIRDSKAHVVLSKSGTPYLGGSWFNYSKNLSDAISAWNKKAGWKPKDLRNCLPTLAARKGILSLAWESYMGHAAKGVTAVHYVPRLASGTLGEGDALNEAMDVFRKLVVEPLEAEITRARTATAGAAVVEIQAVGEGE
jgi:integrase